MLQQSQADFCIVIPGQLEFVFSVTEERLEIPCTKDALDARLCVKTLHICGHLMLPFLLQGGDHTQFADVKTKKLKADV